MSHIPDALGPPVERRNPYCRSYCLACGDFLCKVYGHWQEGQVNRRDCDKCGAAHQVQRHKSGRPWIRLLFSVGGKPGPWKLQLWS